MMRITFLGSSLADLRSFPPQPRQSAGYQLDRLQNGLSPSDWKPMPSIGPGAAELRIRSEDGAFRVVYVANRPEGLFVLHAFKKTSQKTSRHDVAVARTRFLAMTRSGER